MKVTPTVVVEAACRIRDVVAEVRGMTAKPWPSIGRPASARLRFVRSLTSGPSIVVKKSAALTAPFGTVIVLSPEASSRVSDSDNAVVPVTVIGPIPICPAGPSDLPPNVIWPAIRPPDPQCCTRGSERRSCCAHSEASASCLYGAARGSRSPSRSCPRLSLAPPCGPVPRSCSEPCLRHQQKQPSRAVHETSRCGRPALGDRPGSLRQDEEGHEFVTRNGPFRRRFRRGFLCDLPAPHGGSGSEGHREWFDFPARHRSDRGSRRVDRRIHEFVGGVFFVDQDRFFEFLREVRFFFHRCGCRFALAEQFGGFTESNPPV